MTESTNPKDLLGVQKIPVFSVVPPASLIHEAAAMRYGAYEAPRADGGRGYGSYNWREKDVKLSIYLDAAVRHIEALWDGEDLAPDSNVHHAGHAKACLGILLDALEFGNLIDDRPPKGPAAKILERLKQKDLRSAS